MQARGSYGSQPLWDDRSPVSAAGCLGFGSPDLPNTSRQCSDGLPTNEYALVVEVTNTSPGSIDILPRWMSLEPLVSREGQSNCCKSVTTETGVAKRGLAG